jgi:hypothetical protein
MEYTAIKVARATGLTHKYAGQPTARAFTNGWDGNVHFEWGVFDFAADMSSPHGGCGGRIRVKSTTLDVEIERTP